MKLIKLLLVASVCILTACNNKSDNTDVPRKIMYEDLDSTTLVAIKDYVENEAAFEEEERMEEAYNQLMADVKPGLPLSTLAAKEGVQWFIEAGRDGNNHCVCTLYAELGGKKISTNFRYASNGGNQNDLLTANGLHRFFQNFQANTYEKGYTKQINFTPTDFKSAAKITNVAD